MTKYEATIISAYTGFAMTNFSNIHKYAEEKLGRTVFTHEFANQRLYEELREKCKEDFLAICKSADN